MKFAINNSYNLSLGASAQTKNTKGFKLFEKLFGINKKSESDDSKIESLDHDDASGAFELNGEIELSAEISAEEFSELSKFNKENSLLNREELSWFYNGCRKAVANLAEDIKSYGKDIADACYDVSNEVEKRGHQQDMDNISRRFERDVEEEKIRAQDEVNKAKNRRNTEETMKQYSDKESKKD